MRGLCVALVVVCGACRFPELPPVGDDAAATDAAPVDSESIDAPDAQGSPPNLSFESGTYAIALVSAVGVTPAPSVQARLRNMGGSDATAILYTVTPSTAEVTVTDACSGSITTGGSCIVTIAFAAAQAGPRASPSARPRAVGPLAARKSMPPARRRSASPSARRAPRRARVTSTPAGTSCPGQCSATFTTASVSLTATDDNNFH